MCETKLTRTSSSTRFTSLTFDRQFDNSWVLASVFVTGTAKILASNRRHQHSLVFYCQLLISSHMKPNVSLHCGVGVAAAGQSEVSPTVHLQRGSHRHWCVLGAVCGRTETKSEVKQAVVSTAGRVLQTHIRRLCAGLQKSFLCVGSESSCSSQSRLKIRWSNQARVHSATAGRF